MIISIRFNEVDGTLLKTYAESRHETVSGFVKRAVFAQIEEDYYRLLDENTDADTKPDRKAML